MEFETLLSFAVGGAILFVLYLFIDMIVSSIKIHIQYAKKPYAERLAEEEAYRELCNARALRAIGRLLK